MSVIERFTPRELGPKPWGQELLVAETPEYIGKVLFMRSGGTGAFQYHERKDETFHLFSGRALVEYRDAQGARITVEMAAGESYRVPPRAPHRVEALTDCVFFEASTPVLEDRVTVG